MDNLLEDKRPISGLHMGPTSYTVGSDGITDIEVYQETGQMAYVPWFKIWKNDLVSMRINSAHVHVVEYETNDDDVLF